MSTNRLIESYITSGREVVAANTVSVETGDFVSFSNGFGIVASLNSIIEGVSNQTKTYASNNETVAKETLSYTAINDTLVVRVAISGGLITAASEGKYFGLLNKDTVNGGTEAVIQGALQLRMIHFISPTLADFALVN